MHRFGERTWVASAVVVSRDTEEEGRSAVLDRTVASDLEIVGTYMGMGRARMATR